MHCCTRGFVLFRYEHARVRVHALYLLCAYVLH